MVNGVPWEVLRAKTRGAAGAKGFWPRDLPRDSIHHDTPKVFPQLMEPLGSIMVNIPPRLLQTLTVLNPKY